MFVRRMARRLPRR